jgi:hypothetical protein
MTVSAGARIVHLRLALESGRAITVDLSQVPEDLRSSLLTAAPLMHLFCGLAHLTECEQTYWNS